MAQCLLHLITSDPLLERRLTSQFPFIKEDASIALFRVIVSPWQRGFLSEKEGYADSFPGFAYISSACVCDVKAMDAYVPVHVQVCVYACRCQWPIASVSLHHSHLTFFFFSCCFRDSGAGELYLFFQ